jgi:N-acetylmuramoyl-L-alanine amidase
MIKRHSLLLLCIILIFGILLPQEKTSAAEGTVTIATDTVNIRSGPGLSYPLVKVAKRGEKYAIIKEKDDWVEIQLSFGQTGWVVNWLVTKDNNQTTTANASSNDSAAIANSNQLRVRSGPGTSFRVIDILSKGQAVSILDQNENWYKISTPSGAGWVSSEFVDTKDGAATNLQDSNRTGTIGTVTADSLSVRSSSSLNSRIIGTVSMGQSFKILAEHHNWAKIEYKTGSFGWVAGWYLDTTAAPADVGQAANSANGKTVTILMDGTNIRKAPNVQSDILIRANEGDRFSTSNVQNDWYQIKLPNGKTGYVAGWTVSVNGSEPTIVKAGAESYVKNKTIVIDPGHGGGDNGTTGANGTLEKNLTLRTARLLYDKLKAAGANVYLTRNSDTYIALSSRVDMARLYHADAFISLHYDSSDDRSTRGTTGYYYHNYQKALADTVFASTEAETKLTNRGVRLGDFHVVRENSQKAVLIELGYLSNPEEEITLNSSAFQENAASGVYDGLARYFKEN